MLFICCLYMFIYCTCFITDGSTDVYADVYIYTVGTVC